ncbi:DUF4854 domain-containing protein [Clostridium baratii]
MKKLTRNILLVSLITIVSLGLVACNFNKKSNDQSANTTNTTDNAKIDEITKSIENKDNNGTTGTTIEGQRESELFDTIEDALKHPAIKERIQKSMTKDVKISAKGNDLTYVIKLDGLKKSKEVTEQLRKTLNDKKSNFENVANTLLGAINGKEINMIIKYTDTKGETIYEHNFNFKK